METEWLQQIPLVWNRLVNHFSSYCTYVKSLKSQMAASPELAHLQYCTPNTNDLNYRSPVCSTVKSSNENQIKSKPGATASPIKVYMSFFDSSSADSGSNM